MQMKITTDYSIRILAYLAKRPTGATITRKEICEAMGIPLAYFQKLTPPLMNKGYIAAIKGASGGYSLVKPAGEISLWDVLNACEGTMKINRCLEPDKKCSRGAAGYCNMHLVLQRIQDQVEDAFMKRTIADLT